MLHFLNKELITSFITNGVRAIEYSQDVSAVFLCLLEFLENKKQHEQALQTIIRNGHDKTSVMTALGQHLFAQLVPGKDYVVDCQLGQIPDVCTCGCGAKIRKGNTELGSHFTWHGSVDILLNQTIAVSIFDDRIDASDKEDGDEKEYLSSKPPGKKRKKETEKGKTESKIYGELDDMKPRSDIYSLVREDTLNQILSECITNGFAQVNMNEALSGNLIPTFGCTAESVCVCLYDPINDILLQNVHLMDLWASSFEQLNILTIVTVWLFLNFTTYGVKNLMEKIDLDKSGFHNEMQHALRCYRQVKTNMNCASPHTPYWYQGMELCETVYPKIQ